MTRTPRGGGGGGGGGADRAFLSGVNGEQLSAVEHIPPSSFVSSTVAGGVVARLAGGAAARASTQFAMR